MHGDARRLAGARTLLLRFGSPFAERLTDFWLGPKRRNVQSRSAILRLLLHENLPALHAHQREELVHQLLAIIAIDSFMQRVPTQGGDQHRVGTRQDQRLYRFIPIELNQYEQRSHPVLAELMVDVCVEFAGARLVGLEFLDL